MHLYLAPLKAVAFPNYQTNQFSFDKETPNNATSGAQGKNKAKGTAVSDNSGNIDFPLMYPTSDMVEDGKKITKKDLKPAFRILKLKIVNSIFSPPVIKATINVSEVSSSQFIKFYSVYGVVFIDDSSITAATDKSKTNRKTAKHYDLFSNGLGDNPSVTPFVVVEIEKTDMEEDDPASGHLCITLMEKRALSLGLEHTFTVIGNSHSSAKSSKNNNSSTGLISIAEVVERLSNIEEDNDRMLANPSSESKKIVNFRCANINKGRFDSNQLYDPKAPLPQEETTHCAFISRYVAPKSQSRLLTILSLLYKYGYAWSYRPADRQYYAFDLLSITAPGFFTFKGDTSMNSKCFTFGGSREDGAYYISYASMCDKITDKERQAYDTILKDASNTEDNRKNNNLNYMSTNFADFFIKRVVAPASEISKPDLSFSQSGAFQYAYLARYAPLCSATNYITEQTAGEDKFGFDLTLMSRVDKESAESYKEGKKSTDIDSIFSQNIRHTDVSDGENYHFEDQIELNHSGNITTKRFGSKSKKLNGELTTVNQRLNYAAYKLNHMVNNYAVWHFKYKRNSGLSRSYNIVYELFSRLGYHTNLFAMASEITIPKVNSKDKNISENAAGGSTISQEFANFINNYYTNNPYDKTGAVFGKVVIEISLEELSHFSTYGKRSLSNFDSARLGYLYNTNVSMYFYNDLYDYDFGDYAIKNKYPKIKKEDPPPIDDEPKKNKVYGDKTNKKPKKKPGKPEEPEKPEKPEKPKIPKHPIKTGGGTTNNRPKTDRPKTPEKPKNYTRVHGGIEFKFNGKPIKINDDAINAIKGFLVTHVYQVKNLVGVYSNDSIRGRTDIIQPNSLDMDAPWKWEDPTFLVLAYMKYSRMAKFNKNIEAIEYVASLERNKVLYNDNDGKGPYYISGTSIKTELLDRGTREIVVMQTGKGTGERIYLNSTGFRNMMEKSYAGQHSIYTYDGNTFKRKKNITGAKKAYDEDTRAYSEEDVKAVVRDFNENASKLGFTGTDADMNLVNNMKGRNIKSATEKGDIFQGIQKKHAGADSKVVPAKGGIYKPK